MSTAALNPAAASPGTSGAAGGVSSYLAGLLLATAAATIGWAPALVWLGRQRWLPWLAGLAVVMFLVKTRSNRRLRDVFEPRALLLGIGVGAYGSAIAGIIALTFHLLGWLAGGVVAWLWGLFASAPAWTHRLGSWSSVIGVVLGLPLMAVTVAALVEWLRRATAERTAAMAKERRNRTQTLTGLGIGAVLLAVAGFLYLRGSGERHWVFLQVALLFVCTPPWTVVQGAAASSRGTSILHGVRSLLEAAGFQTEVLQLGPHADAAPLLRKIDLVARRGSCYVVVEVKVGDGGPSIDATAASALCIAASALAVERHLDFAAVRPLLVLVGAAGGPELERVAREEHVALLQLSSEEASQVVHVSGSAALARLEEALGAANSLPATAAATVEGAAP
jgi:hypothetical protein